MDDRPLEDWEYPEPDDEDETSVTRPCPSCGTLIYEDAEQCTACGEYIVFPNAVLAGWHWLFLLLGAAGIAALIGTLVWGF